MIDSSKILKIIDPEGKNLNFIFSRDYSKGDYVVTIVSIPNKAEFVMLGVTLTEGMVVRG